MPRAVQNGYPARALPEILRRTGEIRNAVANLLRELTPHRGLAGPAREWAYLVEAALRLLERYPEKRRLPPRARKFWDRAKFGNVLHRLFKRDLVQARHLLRFVRKVRWPINHLHRAVFEIAGTRRSLLLLMSHMIDMEMLIRELHPRLALRF
ncbi:MAG: hypothetical protein HOO96_31915 [Polyangiaceae bacterium]|nr:hypothetical protein [Polyangiaceae bacterium]